MSLLLLILACGNDVSVGKVVIDADDDGYDQTVDCDDAHRDVNPDADERCDGVDNDCDKAVDEEDAVDLTTFFADADADGYGDEDSPVPACEAPAGTTETGGDCNDTNPAIHPDAAETDCTDPVDYNCDGSTAVADSDNDGTVACEDCNDADAAIHPGATEVCNGADDDCDGLVDDDDDPVEELLTWYRDLDGDGWAATGAVTTTGCARPTGFTDQLGDCDDLDAAVSPDADEVCDAGNRDEDCDGLADDADGSVDSSTWISVYRDSDGDYWGDAAVQSCDAPAGFVYVSGDCDDANDAINPVADERCNGVDDDCDNQTDDQDSSVIDLSTWYIDGDGDGWGSTAQSACQAPLGTVAVGGDCNDANAAIQPDAVENCNGADDDCDSLVDDDDPDVVGASLWYRDQDLDGYAASGAASVTSCTAPSGFTALGGDCDDLDGAVNPGARERCDNGRTDEDCDGLVDDADGSVDSSTWSSFYRDLDGDSFGGSTTVQTCEAPSGFVAVGGDCLDSDGAVNPNAQELCNGQDDDCDGLLDDADSSVSASASWYADGDGDGWGAGTARIACVAPAGHVATAGDCDDQSAAVSPGATESCNAIDDDCDGSVDTNVSGAPTWYLDSDGDGYGAGTPLSACSRPSNYVSSNTDCNDGSAAISPGAVETCNSLDDDCDSLIDDDDSQVTGGSTWYTDADGDGYGSGTAFIACTGSGASSTSTDCDDNSATVHPTAADACSDGIDADCDGRDGTCRSGLYPASDADVVWTSERTSYGSGAGINTAGDVNADGIEDLLIGDPYDDSYGTQSGKAWLIYGGSGLVAGGTLAGQRSIEGTDSGRGMGRDVAPAGDIDGDGYDDFVVGATGRVYLYYGGSSAPFGVNETASGTVDTLFTCTYLNCAMGQYLGMPSGDFDGDGNLDLLMPDIFYNSSSQGAVWLVYGTGSRWGSAQNVSSGGVIYSASGKSVMGYDGALDVGDLDGDGIDDLIAGHYWRVNTATATAYQGWAYLYYGDGTRITTAVSTSTADANWTGQAVQDNFATSIRVLPDLDEDGLPELAFGAVGIDSPTTNAGNLLIWGGSATRLSGAILPSSADLKIRGAASSSMGSSVVGVEDMDGDGNAEVAVGATAYPSAYNGAYGGLFVYEAPLNLSAATLEYTDADYGWESNVSAILSRTLASGDFDGDGLSDLVSGRGNAGTNPYGALIFLGE